jgi:hypothetical protein
MLICVCLRILASLRIPRYDLGRQTPHFGGGSVTTTSVGVANLRHHLMLHRLLHLHLGEEQIHTLLDPLSPLLRSRTCLLHRIQDELRLLGRLGVGFGLRRCGDHTWNSANQGGIYRKQCSVIDFASHHLNRPPPPNGILWPSQRKMDLVPWHSHGPNVSDTTCETPLLAGGYPAA